LLTPSAPPVPDPAGAWRQWLEAWAIPDDILRAAPESPWGFSPRMFERAAEKAMADVDPSPSRRRALDALGRGGSVLDVGAGAGAASLPLVPPAEPITAVDESGPMLESFAAAAERLGVEHREILGRWPDVAPRVPVCDVVVCHHVLYNVAALEPFAQALDAHARRRVVVELSAAHPQSDLSPLWKEIHGLDRPQGPSASDALAVLASMGFDVGWESFTRPTLWEGVPLAERVAFARRRLCTGPEHDELIEEYLVAHGDLGSRCTVTLWWDVG